ncbi:EVE domain-containing protein [Petrachloros mirabilis]
MSKPRHYWLMKSEPNVFSINDLARSPKQRTSWEGVRNYQARNFMREMAVGDRVLFYHSNADPPAIVGIAEIVRTAYPDDTQFDRKSRYYDQESSPSAPRWDMVDIKHRETFKVGLPLDQLRRETRLRGMELLRKGSRLSVQPVTEAQWAVVLELAGAKSR